MGSLNPSMRLKLKADTFFLPDAEGGVYFRNNEGSFRMEGSSIYQWVEKLVPVLTGDYTLSELTDGLPDAYREMVYNIAEALIRNRVVRDVSQDVPHGLPSQVVEYYAAQIEFLDELRGSGGHHFETYRETAVLAVGSGSFLVSLVEALFTSGLPTVHLLLTDGCSTNRERLSELVQLQQRTDPHVSLHLHTPSRESFSWNETVKPFDAILFVSSDGKVDELQELCAVCEAENKLFLPVICAGHVGLAGPLMDAPSAGSFASAWRRIHQTVLDRDPKYHVFSPSAAGILANLIVYELFKTRAGVMQSPLRDQFYLLNLETLEGAWHGFLPHPLVAGYQSVKRLSDEEMRACIRQPEDSAEGLALLPYFDGLSSAETGILHIWEEGELPQIPFAACRVQAVDATAEGPAGLLPEKVCLGLTHEEARRKAGLVGIEAYTANILSSLDMKDFPVKDGIAVGAGQTFAEALSRGLQKCLSHAWVNRPTQASPDITPVEIVSIEDELCRYGLEVLAATQGPLTLGLGDKLHGFPVVWLGTGKAWYATVGLSVPLALRYVLEQALLARPSQATPNTIDERKRLTIQQCDRTIQAKTLLDALVTLRDNGMCIDIVDLSIEPFMRETIAGVFGVWLREEASQ